MKSTRVGRFVFVFALLGLAAAILWPTHVPLAKEKGPRKGGTLKPQLTSLRVPFIRNDGQADPRVAFYAPMLAGTVFVTKGGEIVYSLPTKSAYESASWTLTETLLGGSPSPQGEGIAETRVSVFLGDDASRWRSRLPAHESLALGEVWPGVNVSVRIHAKSVEKLFTISPGSRAEAIRVGVSGADSLRADPTGGLVAETGAGEVVFSAPIAFQEIGEVQRRVDVAYAVGNREYGFALGPYDARFPVVIDPLLQSTYLGGTVFEGTSTAGEAVSIVVHPASGDVYVGGRTTSTDFPGTSGGAQPANGGGTGDAYIARLNAGLTSLLQATYLGGSGDETFPALAVHPTTGDVYIAGGTNSADIPGTAGGAQSARSGPSDGFVARLNASLTALTQATYIGGTMGDGLVGIAVHPTTGEVYVTGGSGSTDFPAVAGGAQTTRNGVNDLVISRLNAALTSILQSTYLGGSTGIDSSKSGCLAFSPVSGDVYVAGQVPATGFPGTAGGAQPSYGGGNGDAVISRLNAGLTSLLQSTYLGGSALNADGQGVGIAVHPVTGDVYAALSAPSSNMPGTAGGAQPTHAGNNDAYIARLNAGLTSILQATYLGGTGSDADGHIGIAIHPTTGEIYVAGTTQSTTFPGTAGGAQPTHAGGTTDVFVTRHNAGLTSRLQSTFLGGNQSDGLGTAIAIHPTSGQVYVAAETGGNFPGVAGGAQPTFGGLADLFVARLTADLAGAGAPTPTPTATPTGTPVATPTPIPPVGPMKEYGLIPCRILDTRNPVGPYGGPALSSGGTRTVILWGQCGIPSTARAAVLNVTVTEPTGAGYLTLWPSTLSQPLASTMNFASGQTRANNAVIRLGTDGGINIFGGLSAGTTHVVLDVNGYFE